ncbi:MAG: hypothetical protein WBV79_10895, partial [Rhodomicrobium sp.]
MRWRCPWFDRLTMRFNTLKAHALILSLSKDEVSISCFFCIPLAPDHASDRLGVEPLLPNHNQAAASL